MEPAVDSSDIRYWLALNRIPGIGGSTFRSLLEKAGQPGEIFNRKRRDLQILGLNEKVADHILAPDWETVDKDIAWLEKPDRCLLTLNDPNYPYLLKQIHDPPPVLFVHGKPSIAGLPQVAIVGSRNPTVGGKKNAYEFAANLIRAGLTVTSGLALGIDGESHKGALDAGGNTIAVTGNGLDLVYPARHKDLAHRISRHGALISEFAPGTPPAAKNFPRRNRIISGLCMGTLVIEATLKSGSLITAKSALEQGREVFAVPGSIVNPLSKGCHALLREGAKLVENVHDILQEINSMGMLPPNPEESEPSVTDLQADHERVLENIAYDPTPVDTLVELTGDSPESIASTLLVLELQGYISSAAGGWYYRIK